MQPINRENSSLLLQNGSSDPCDYMLGDDSDPDNFRDSGYIPSRDSLISERRHDESQTSSSVALPSLRRLSEERIVSVKLSSKYVTQSLPNRELTSRPGIAGLDIKEWKRGNHSLVSAAGHYGDVLTSEDLALQKSQLSNLLSKKQQYASMDLINWKVKQKQTSLESVEPVHKKSHLEADLTRLSDQSPSAVLFKNRFGQIVNRFGELVTDKVHR